MVAVTGWRQAGQQACSAGCKQEEQALGQSCQLGGLGGLGGFSGRTAGLLATPWALACRHGRSPMVVLTVQYSTVQYSTVQYCTVLYLRTAQQMPCWAAWATGATYLFLTLAAKPGSATNVPQPHTRHARRSPAFSTPLPRSPIFKERSACHL
jgi:hypothetical protein